MSPIEAQLYEAMGHVGLYPVPQFCIQGFYVDFAFPDVYVAVEADGAAYHTGARRERDRKRDWILRKAGWTIKRFHGTTIYHRAANCAYVVKQEVEARRQWAYEHARQEAMWARFRAEQTAREREAMKEAIRRPFRKLIQFLKNLRRA